VGPLVAVTTPSPIRAISSHTKDVAAPAKSIATAHSPMLIASSRVRRVRSVRTPIGIVPSAAASAVTDTSKPMEVLLIPKARCKSLAVADSVATSAPCNPRAAARIRMTRARARPPTSALPRSHRACAPWRVAW
jgi:hypothetical protein